MVDNEDPCAKGLTDACFKARPKHAKQVLAYRVLGMLLGLQYRKRLQKFKGLPLPIGLDAEIGAPLANYALSGIYSALSPILISVWEGGPPNIKQAIEGDLEMATLRKAKVDFSGAETKEIITAIPGVTISVTNIALVIGGETNITLKSGSTAISGPMDFGGTNEPRGMTHALGLFPLNCTEGEAFNITSSAAVQVSGYITYYLS